MTKQTAATPAMIQFLLISKSPNLTPPNINAVERPLGRWNSHVLKPPEIPAEVATLKAAIEFTTQTAMPDSSEGIEGTI
jgi:hypothetical protein